MNFILLQAAAGASASGKGGASQYSFITIREEDLIIETGADRNKMRIQRWAVNTNKTKAEQHQKEVEAAREAAKNKKNKKNKDDALTEKSDTAKEAEEKIEK